VITSGASDTAPFAAYVQGSAALQAGGRQAVLAVCAEHAGAQASWQCENLDLPTGYPDQNAPGALATSSLPLQTGSSSDSTLDKVAEDYPSPTNTYEVRLYTSTGSGGFTSARRHPLSTSII
jgi:hypothetical protein